MTDGDVPAGARSRAGERRTQEQRSAQTRAKLMDATVECLVEFGYGGTTTISSWVDTCSHDCLYVSRRCGRWLPDWARTTSR